MIPIRYFKNSFILLFFILIKCDNSFQPLLVSTIDFDESDLEFCTADVKNILFFKRKDDEAVILLLQSGIITNQAASRTISSLTTSTKLIYRSFSENVPTTYFCNQVLPPLMPFITNQFAPQSGTLTITSTLNETQDSISHQLQLNNIIFQFPNGESLTHETIDYGTFKYELPISGDMVMFENTTKF